MLEGVELGFDRNHMVYSVCRDCACFRAFCFSGKEGHDAKAGFCCCEGKRDDFFLPYEFPVADDETRASWIRKYNENDLPEECRFHTQCSMLNFMEDEDETSRLAEKGYEVATVKVKELDFSDAIVANALRHDSSLKAWCDSHGDGIAVLFRKDDGIHAFALMCVERRNCDYSWILPTPPKFYFQKGDSRLAVRVMCHDGEIHNAHRMLLSQAYMHALEKKVDELYVVSYGESHAMLQNSGFRFAGYMLGGDGSDDDTGAKVMVKKLDDLENER